MRRILSLLLIAALVLPAAAKKKKEAAPEEGFVFTTVKANPITSIKNQNQSGTCWAYSGLAFFESELLRMGKGDHELSRMFVAHHTYQDRGVNYVRFHGDAPLGQGGSFYDVVYCLENYGIVPQSVYVGIEYGDSLPNFTELDPMMTGVIQTVAKSKNSKLSPAWKKAYYGVLDAYFGPLPETFTFEGKEYTPKSYAASLGLNMQDYVGLTSFTHHPFYAPFAIEVQDNWRGGLNYNLPLDEFMEVMDYAVRNGYTFAWGSDVSEMGFTRNGVCVMPDAQKGADLNGSDMARWLKLSAQDRNKELTSKPMPEIEVTQEMRQEAFDNWETTDDHGMLIYGLATDQNGKEYFMVKNSWGNMGYNGTWYASKAFVAYKTLNILIHKDAIPAAIRQKLGL